MLESVENLYHENNKTWTRLSQVVKYRLAIGGGMGEAQPIKLPSNIHNWCDNAFLMSQHMSIHFMKYLTTTQWLENCEKGS